MSEHTRTARERAEELYDSEPRVFTIEGPKDAYVKGFLARDAEVAAEIRTARSMELEDAAESYRRGDRHPFALNVRAYLKRRALQVRGEQS